jgi:hypothetical protein
LNCFKFSFHSLISLHFSLQFPNSSLLLLFFDLLLILLLLLQPALQNFVCFDMP